MRMRGQAVGARSHTFERVPADVAAYCVRLGEAAAAKRGDVLSRQGDSARRCYYVRSGYARVTSNSPAGHQILVGYIGPHDIVGQAAATRATNSYLATTVAVQRMELICWTREAALALGEQFPEIHARLDALFARNMKIVLARLHTVSEGRLPGRLATALLELAARHGTPDGQGVAIGPLVTRDDLAALTGASMYTVSRVLADWEHRGLLTSRRGRVRLVDLARLRALAR
jgi:CRP-like cAMP-binding protein